MYIHKEGHRILLGFLAILIVINGLIYYYFNQIFLFSIIVSTILYLLVLQFFRNPKRSINKADNHIVYAPADGKVVVIEETEEPEYFKDRRLQVSIFMSPLNVHVNRNPVSGNVQYYRYHEGKYLVAWHPKSSTENERTTTVIKTTEGKEILLRQIAGAVAKRIINYVDEGQKVIQGTDMGFIKFGSRVDIFLPLDADIQVSIDDKVIGNKTIIAKI